MRSNPADYDLVAPGNLQAVISLLAEQPGKWLPIAGGTDVMVQYAAGKLTKRNWVGMHLYASARTRNRQPGISFACASGTLDWRNRQPESWNTGRKYRQRISRCRFPARVVSLRGRID